jgi:hypothetical protein
MTEHTVPPGENRQVSMNSIPVRRFGPDFVAEHRRKYGNRAPERRQLTYDLAVEDRYAPWRDWLDDQLALLPTRAAALARRVWLDEHFWTVNFELAVGAGLRAAGLTVAYERQWDGLGPDWTVLSGDDRPLCFVEVHTDGPAAGTFAQMRAWHALVERIKRIPVAVVLQVASGGPSCPLTLAPPKRSPVNCGPSCWRNRNVHGFPVADTRSS